MIKGLPDLSELINADFSPWDIQIQELAKKVHAKHVENAPQLRADHVEQLAYGVYKTENEKPMNKARATTLLAEAAKYKAGMMFNFAW